MIIPVVNKNGDSLLGDKGLIIPLLILTIVIPLVFITIGASFRNILNICLIPLLVIFAFNYELAILSFIISLFLNLHISYFISSEVVGGLLIISFFFTHRFDKPDFRNPLLIPLGICFAALLPSFFNADDALFTSFLSIRTVIFACLILLISISITNYDWIKKIINLYLVFCFINSIDVIYTGLTTGQRVFGFTGIVFVDYVSIAIIICFLSAIHKEKNYYRYIALTIIFGLASILTQTRNTWISCVAALSLILIQFYRKGTKLGYNKKRVSLLLTVILCGLVIAIVLVLSFHPETFSRLAVAGVRENATVTEDDMSAIGSIATRFLIWITAWNAFMAHPFIGIGLYNFSIVSAQYSTISPVLYNTFVKGLSPHIGYLEVLTETGIIGLSGFLSFIFYIIKVGKTAIKKAKFGDQYFYSIMLLWIQVYTFFSMAMSDAWLWGHCLMLWGISLSMLVANYRIVNHPQESK